MPSIVILAASFITALIGIIRNNRANPDEQSIFGLNLLGAVLLGLSITGATAALVQEIRSLRAKVEDKRTINDFAHKLDQSLSTQIEVAHKLDLLADKVKDPSIKRALTEASGRLGLIKVDEHADMPLWVPIYPGIQPEDVRKRTDQNGWSGSYTFPVQPVIVSQFFVWYRNKLREDGFTITTDDTNKVVWGRLEAQDPSGHRRFTLTHQDPLKAHVLWEERNK
jgi:hypothetical protein